MDRNINKTEAMIVWIAGAPSNSKHLIKHLARGDLGCESRRTVMLSI